MKVAFFSEVLNTILKWQHKIFQKQTLDMTWRTSVYRHVLQQMASLVFYVKRVKLSCLSHYFFQFTVSPM